MTKYGRPPSVVPASSTLAMFGWSIRASACRSASNRASTRLRVHPGLDDLHRDHPADRLRLLGHADGAHAALADLLQQLVRPDAAPRPLGDRFVRGGPVLHGRGAVQETAEPALRGEQLLDVPAQPGVAGAGAVQVSGPIGRVGDVQSGGEDGAFVHGWSLARHTKRWRQKAVRSFHPIFAKIICGWAKKAEIVAVRRSRSACGARHGRRPRCGRRCGIRCRGPRRLLRT